MKSIAVLLMSVFLLELVGAEEASEESKGFLRLPSFQRKEKETTKSENSLLKRLPGLNRDKQARFGASEEGFVDPAEPQTAELEATVVPYWAEDADQVTMATPGPLPQEIPKERRLKMPSVSLPSLPSLGGENGMGSVLPGKTREVPRGIVEAELMSYFSPSNPPEGSLAAFNPSLREAILINAPEVDRLRRNGVVGENSRGLLDVRGSLDEEDLQVMREENRNRRRVYEEIARGKQVDYQRVGRAHARLIWDTLGEGNVWIHNSKEEWVRR